MATFDPGYQPPPGLPSSLLSGLLTVIHERHMDMVALISGLPPGALAWPPAPDAPHLSGIAMHTLEVEEYVADVASGGQTEWSGELGSSMDIALDASRLISRITRVDERLKRSLESVNLERLETLEPTGERTAGSLLVEVLDHAAMHYGQMQLTRHLWEVAHPEFDSRYQHWR